MDSHKKQLQVNKLARTQEALLQVQQPVALLLVNPSKGFDGILRAINVGNRQLNRAADYKKGEWR
jgi:hypothetical protein